MNIGVMKQFAVATAFQKIDTSLWVSNPKIMHSVSIYEGEDEESVKRDAVGNVAMKNPEWHFLWADCVEIPNPCKQ